jgi:hypothetical protein
MDSYMTKIRATECLIRVDKALQLKRTLKESGHSLAGLLICKHCKRPVKPLESGRTKDFGRTTPAHFEHLKRNIECPLSEKSKAKQLYAEHQAERVKAKAKR